MTRPFLRVDLSTKDADFRSVALQPGSPLLGKSSPAGTLLREWLGRFVADVAWKGNTVEYFVCGDDGCRYADIEPHVATRQELRGKLKREFAELKTRLEQASPVSASAQPLHRFLCDGLLDPQPGKGFVDLKCQFFKYRDFQNRWRLLWCPGLQPTIDDRPMATVICKTPDCRQLALTDGNREQTCRRCETPFHPKIVHRRLRRWAAIFLLLLAIAAGVFFYLLPKEVLTGRVICAADGQPVSGAEIQIAGRPPVTSDENGAFRIERLPRGIVGLEISASGYHPQSLEKELRGGEDDSAEIRLVGSGELPGTVIYMLGTKEIPVSGARVSFGLKEEDAVVESDEAGKFVLSGVPPRPVKLDVSARGFSPATLDAGLWDEAPLRVVLRGNGKIAGTVVYSADKSRPIPGVHVAVEGIEQATTETDEDGRFALLGIPPGPVQVNAVAAGYRNSAVQTEVTEGPLQIALVGDAILAGSAVRADTNVPAAGAKVRVVGTPFETVADEEGQFRLEDVRSGKVRIEATMPGLSAVTEEDLPPKRVTPIELALKGDAAIRGRVLSALDQSPIAGAKVAVAETQLASETGSDGLFVVDGICAGEVKLQVSAENYMPQEVSKELRSGQQELEDLALNPITSVAGRVVRALDRQPVADAKVVIEGSDLTAQTKENGDFLIAEIPAGRKNIRVAAPGYLPQEIEQNLLPGKHRVEEIALIGDTDLKGVVLSVGMDGKRVAIPNAAVEVEVGNFRTTLTSADNGGFTVGKVPAGNVKLTARAEGYRDAALSLSVAPGKPWVEIPMTRVPIVKGVVLDADNRQNPVADATIEVDVDGEKRTLTSGQDGGFVIGPVSTEQIKLTAHADGYRDEVVSQTVSTNKPWVEILMKPMIDVRGVVIDAADHRRPVANASVTMSIDGTKRDVTTGPDGGFAIENVFSGQVDVAVRAEGYSDKAVSETVDPSHPWIEVELAPLVAAQGFVFEASSRKPVAGASVQLNVGGMTKRVTSAANGVFTMQLPLGDVKAIAEASGYAAASLRKSLSPDDTRLEIPMWKSANVTGLVVSALTNQPVSGARVRLNAHGVEGSDITDARGRFEIAAMPIGPATVNVSRNDFEPITFAEDIDGGSPLHIVLNPKIAEGEIRIVLTWASEPKDLDAHLIGADISGAQYHVSYRDREANGVSLDVDVRDGLGPETITIRSKPGRYEYYVADYKNLGEFDRRGLAKSQAQVRVYSKNVQSQQVLRIDGTPGGPVWHVMDIVVDQDRKSTIVPVHRFSEDLP